MNAGGNSARVYFYALVSDATFLATPVQAFWDDPQGVLGSDLVGPPRDATVRPGETSIVEELAIGNAAFLGVAADLRAPSGGSWRAVLPASQVRGQTLQVVVTEGGLTLTTR
jgi:type VI secretion system VasD/TssJ family lipoprotein